MRDLFSERSGFTLIEIIVVIFIITVITAAVLPSFSRMLTGSVTSDAKSAASIIRYLSDDAMNTKTEETLEINLDKKTFSYVMEGKDRTTEINSLSMVDFTPEGIKYAGVMKVVFPPAGLPSKLKVRLMEKDINMDVIYNPYSGRVSVEEVQPEDKTEKNSDSGQIQ